MEQDAQAMNLRIGKLIEMRLAATRQALNVLIHATTSQGGLYDQAGQSVAAHTGKPLTAA
jgi:flagella synthesis protein FlgN